MKGCISRLEMFDEVDCIGLQILRREMTLCMCMVLLAVFAWIVPLVSGCGLEDVAAEIQPEVTVINLVPGVGTEDDCPGCPYELKVTTLYFAETSATQWGVAVAFDVGCIDYYDMTILSSVVHVWEKDVYGIWHHATSVVLPSPQCVNGLQVWGPFDEMCPDKEWCGIPDPWLSLTLETFKGIVIQEFARPVTGLPVTIL